ncbi:MAG TPA: 2'-5' RNA ligase family protein, partial [Flavisolibacter sp.]|nr:2'-5' RNA ligase family protein [Flavisolibacter sp.]
MTLYFTALVLPETLNARILPLKQHMFTEYGCRVGLNSPAHITLLPPFKMDKRMEEELVRSVDELSVSLAPIDVKTANFSAFPPRTIFIDVGVSPSLKSLKEASDRHFSAHPTMKVKIDTRPFHPHITFATRDLDKRDFQTAWLHFKDQGFE